MNLGISKQQHLYLRTKQFKTFKHTGTGFFDLFKYYLGESYSIKISGYLQCLVNKKVNMCKIMYAMRGIYYLS